MAVLLILAAAAATASGGADAGAPRAAPAMAVDARFARLDRNRDGVITANEAPRVVRTRCDCVTVPEPQPASGGWLADHDRDGDARVTAEEFAARFAAAGGDGELARARPPLR